MRYIDPKVILDARFAKRARPSWDVVVLIFRDARGSAVIKDVLGATPFGDRVFSGMEAPFTHSVPVGNRNVGIIEQCAWGGPQTAMLVEEIAALGVRFIIGIGACGSVAPSLPKGTQVAAIESFITDGTSAQYCKRSTAAASEKLLATLRELFPHTVRTVKSASIDALYRETPEIIEGLKQKGTEIINMETSTLYAASAVCGVESIWLGHVSDGIVGNEWTDWDCIEDMAAETARLCKKILACDICRDKRSR